MVFDGRLDDRRRAGFAVRVKRMAALGDAPAVVVPFVDQVRLLPEVLAVLSDPDVAGLLVAGDSPGIAEAVGPGFGPKRLSPTIRIVLGTEYVLPAAG